MNPYQAEKLASQHRNELRGLCARSGHTRPAKQARQAKQTQIRAHQGRGNVIRRRAGWALVSLGLRLAYGAGED